MNKKIANMRIISSLILTIMLAGCVSTNSLTQITTFGAGTSSIAENSKKAFDLIDSSTIERKMYDVASNASLYPTDSTFEGLFNEDDLKKIGVRIAVLEKLGSYAKSLEKLASADFRKDIDSASTDLYESLNGLSSTYKKATNTELKIKDDQLKLIASAVDAIGTVIVESKRRDAIKTIIVQADDAVQDAAILLEKEFGKDSELSKIVQQNLTNADGSLRTAYNSQRAASDSTFNLRYEMLIKIKQMHASATTVPLLFNSISAGVKKVRDAHATLKASVINDEFSSSELAKQMGELVAYSKSVNSFYEKLGTKN